MVENLVGLKALLDEVEAAEILKVKPSTMTQWRSRGLGPRWVPCGDLPRYRVEDLQEYIDARVVTPTPKPKAAKDETAMKRKRGRPRGKAKK